MPERQGGDQPPARAPAAAVILAAGGGRRFGLAPKLLAELDGRPLLEHAINAATAVDELEPVIVVLGAHADRVLSRVAFGRASAVVCRDWRSGMSASLRCGIAALPAPERVIVTLGDAPTLSPQVFRRFLDAPAGARAAYGGIPGHPVVLGPEQLQRLPELDGDVGARQLLGAGPVIECGDLASGRDVDTPDDLDELRRSLGPGT